MKFATGPQNRCRIGNLAKAFEQLKHAGRNAPRVSVVAALLSTSAAGAAALRRGESVDSDPVRSPGFFGLPAEIGSGIAGEFQVNDYTTGDQIRSSVATDADGDFVVVWQSYGSSETDTDNFSIQGQRYDKTGAPVGDQFQVNEYTTGAQSAPVVAMDADGDFIVAWQSDGSGGSDQDGLSIQARLFSGNGTPGTEIQVNTYTTENQQYPSVSVDSDGDFVVAWMSTDSLSLNIRARRYNSAGVSQGDDFLVNTYTTGSQFFPDVAMDSDGDFVVAWASSGTPAGQTDTDGLSIQAQRYNNSGVSQGGQFQVNTYTTQNQIYPAVDMDEDGDFVIVWQSDGSDGTDMSASSIQAQIFRANGSPKGEQFQVNAFTTGSQFNAEVAMNADGDFIVVWDSFGSGGDDTQLFSVQGRYYLRDGFSQYEDFQVNQYTTNNQNRSSVASDDFGDFIVVWESDGSSGTDNLQKSIQARLYPKPPRLLYLPVVLQD